MTLFFVYRDDPGPILWSSENNAGTAPDLSFDPSLKAVKAPDGTPDAPGEFSVSGGALVARTSTLAGEKFSRQRAAFEHCTAVLAAGFSFNGAVYQVDAGSQASIAAMGIMALGSITDPAGSPWPAGFYWIAADNSHVAMDAPTMYAFGRAVAGYVSACVLRLRAIKDAIAAAADQAALDAIDVTAGYPPASA